MKIRHPERYEKWSSIMDDWKSTGLSVAEYVIGQPESAD
jgi:hypothetical protein